MIDVLQTALPLSSPATATPAGAAVVPVAGADVERFRNALAGGDTSSPAAASASALSAAASAPVAQRPASTAGDAILAGLKDSYQQISQAWAQAADLTAQPVLSTAQMLGVQAKLLQASGHFEMLSKGISKTSQNLDQILKTQ